jgi:hypothetical protein
MTYESRQSFATTNAIFWQKDANFWTRYDQRTKANQSHVRAADYLNELINHKPHQAEY